MRNPFAKFSKVRKDHVRFTKTPKDFGLGKSLILTIFGPAIESVKHHSEDLCTVTHRYASRWTKSPPTSWVPGKEKTAVVAALKQLESWERKESKDLALEWQWVGPGRV